MNCPAWYQAIWPMYFVFAALFLGGVMLRNERKRQRTSEPTWRQKEAIACMMLIDLMCDHEEGLSITLTGDNPDFIGPNSVVEVEGTWPSPDARGFHGWHLRHFEGTSRLDCLRAAAWALGVVDQSKSRGV